MTEQEAVEILTLNSRQQKELPMLKEVYAVAVQALEEIQKYRSVGTVEEIRRMQKYSALAKKHGTIGKVIESCAEYEEIGTVEECREAVEKQKADKC